MSLFPFTDVFLFSLALLRQISDAVFLYFNNSYQVQSLDHLENACLRAVSIQEQYKCRNDLQRRKSILQASSVPCLCPGALPGHCH